MKYPHYFCRGRQFFDINEALFYSRVHGGYIMIKLDSHTPAYQY